MARLWWTSIWLVHQKQFGGHFCCLQRLRVQRMFKPSRVITPVVVELVRNIEKGKVYCDKSTSRLMVRLRKLNAYIPAALQCSGKNLTKKNHNENYGVDTHFWNSRSWNFLSVVIPSYLEINEQMNSQNDHTNMDSGEYTIPLFGYDVRSLLRKFLEKKICGICFDEEAQRYVS